MSTPFHYQGKELYVESVPITKIVREVGSPSYIYSYQAMQEHYQSYVEAFKDFSPLICYSMKSNSNLAILSGFVKQGSGVDIVSQGELFRALKAGADPQKIVFSGVGKTAEEMKYAIQKKILMFNVESEAELEVLNDVASKLKKKAPVALRVNPDIDPKTHPYITTGMKKSKFGIQYERAFEVYQRASQMKGIELIGIDCHIGSQLTQVDPFVAALERVLDLVDRLADQGVSLKYIDLGGGLGIKYQNERPPSPKKYAQALKKLFKGRNLSLILEPGRSLIGNAGVLCTQVLYPKDRDNKHFLIVDAAMNDLIRPAFYESYHEILPVIKKSGPKRKYDVVGPICETGDFLAQDRLLPRFQSKDLMAVMSAGAYGFTMASQYNSRPRVCEILVKGKKFFVIRKREKLVDLIRGEEIPAFLKS